jgi:hypothetical protein
MWNSGFQFCCFCSTAAEDSILMGYDTAARGNQIPTFHGNIVFLSPRVDMSQDIVHVDH